MYIDMYSNCISPEDLEYTLMEFYRTMDVYYCSDCGQFFDELGNVVRIPYTDMPAMFAIEVMSDRTKHGWCHPRGRKRTAKRIKSDYTY